jgi:hypothetical protein
LGGINVFTRIAGGLVHEGLGMLYPQFAGAGN